MTDKNGVTIEAGQYIQVIKAKVKNDNGIYISESRYTADSFCLKKVKQNGEQANTKYNIFFLDQNSIKNNPDMVYTVITKEQLKQAAKEVKAYIDGKTAKETIFTFSKAENQTLEELQEGQVIHFVKCVQWQGHINSQRGKYIISKIENGSFRLHLLGARGGEIADNMNGYYQFTPIHINLTSKTIQQLFDEDYIEILERHASTKGERVKTNKKQSVKTVSYDVPQSTETEEKQVNKESHIEPEKTVEAKQEQKNTEQKKDIASLCSQCKNFNVNCKGMDAVWTGCVCYNKDSILPTVEILAEQPSTEQTQKDDTEYKSMTESTETETTADEQQENTNNGLATEYHAIKEQNTEQKQTARSIKAVYYPINEALARTAKTINSFYDYTTDEATRAYKNHIAEVETLAQQKAEQHPERADDIQALLNKYSKKYAEWKNRYYAIECMCPSIMVCGGGNFPVRKKEKQNKARDRHMQNYEYIQSILAKIENIGSQREQIKSSDENAIDKLQAKVDELKADLDRSKAMNKYFRKNKTMLGFEGLTDEQATKIDNAITNAYSFDKQPAPSFELASIRNKIKTAEGRISEIKRLKESAEQNTENQEQSIYKSDVCQVVENTELMRIQLLFDGKPSDEIRNILKSNGFRWSPSNKAWQRQLTDNARYTTKRVLKQLEE